jgi:uracil-DNA glycosylase family 4
MTSKQKQLQAISKEVEDLKESPLYGYRQEHGYHMVFGEGDVDTKIMFIGEAPGEKEARSGRPFVGPSGKVLDKLLNSIDLTRNDVYITNVVKDRPPNNRDPRIEEIELYKPYLLHQIEIIQPNIIVPLGRFAMEFIFDEFKVDKPEAKISELHGHQLVVNGPYGKITVVPLYHPAVALYNQSQRTVLEEDFAQLKKLIS